MLSPKGEGRLVLDGRIEVHVVCARAKQGSYSICPRQIILPWANWIVMLEHRGQVRLFWRVIEILSDQRYMLMH